MERSLVPAMDELKAIELMAKNAVESKYFEKLGGYAGVFSIAMYARELGLPIMASLFGGMQNIMGKVQISPQMMNSMIRSAGHKLDINSSDTVCTITGTRRDTGETASASFSVDEAKKAGIFKAGGGWDKYPSDMCFARALSRLARRLFPDVIGVAYVEGEIVEDESKKNKPFQKKEEPRQAETIEIAEEKIERTLVEIETEFNEKYSDIAGEGLLSEYVKGSSKKRNQTVFQFMEACLNNDAAFREVFVNWVKKQTEQEVVSG